MDNDRKNNLGKISLCLAIVGIIGPVFIGLCLKLFPGIIPIPIYVLIFVALEITALVTGIVAWRSPYGKAGLGVSVSLLLLLTFFVPLFKTVTYEGRGATVVEAVEYRPIQSESY
jgi:hypothetical protein